MALWYRRFQDAGSGRGPHRRLVCRHRNSTAYLLKEGNGYIDPSLVKLRVGKSAVEVLQSLLFNYPQSNLLCLNVLRRAAFKVRLPTKSVNQHLVEGACAGEEDVTRHPMLIPGHAWGSLQV
jgi:hypothetical protein